MQTKTSKLRQIRNTLGVSREDVLRKTKGVSIGTIRNAEVGNNRIRQDKASEILSAINLLLTEVGKPVVTLDALGLTLYREEVLNGQK